MGPPDPARSQTLQEQNVTFYESVLISLVVT